MLIHLKPKTNNAVKIILRSSITKHYSVLINQLISRFSIIKHLDSLLQFLS